MPTKHIDAPHRFTRTITPRLKEVAKVLCDDCLDFKEGAEKLGVSIKTIEKQAQSLHYLLNIGRRSELCKIYWTTDKLR